MSNRNVILRLIGGLGNQLFQLQHAHNFLEKYDGQLTIDDSFLASSKKKHEVIAVHALLKDYKINRLSWFDLYIRRFVERIFYKINISFPTIFEPLFVFEHSKLEVRNQKRIVLDGFWQNKKYINNIFLNKIRKIIANKKLAKDLKSINFLAVCVHIRRGDYLTNKNYFFRSQSVLSMKYYLNAFDLYKKNNTASEFHIYTDDEPWARTFFKDMLNVVVISSANDDPFDLMLKMSCYSRFVIANSTLSWWAAVISSAENKVVVLPKLWLANESSERFRLSNWRVI